MTIKKVLVLIVLFSLFVSVFAFDYGGNLNSSLYTDTDKSKSELLNLNNSIDLWFSFPVDFSGNTYLTLGGLFGGNIELRNSYDSVATEMFYDISAVNLTMQIPLDLNNVCNYKMGRFDWADSTKTIYNGKIDALCFYFDFLPLKLDFTAGYTGLLNGKTQQNYGVTLSESAKKEMYTKNPSSFIGALTFVSKQGILDFLGFTKIDLETLVNYSFDSADKSNLYLTGIIENQLSKTLFYHVTSSFQFPLGSTKKPANFTKATITFGSEKTFTKINGAFASSNDSTPEASLSEFTPISAIPLDKKGIILPNSILAVGGAFEIKPSKKFNIEFLADAYFNVTSNSQFGFNQLQWSANFDLHPVSDFALSLKLGQSVVSLINPFYISFSTKITY